MFAKKRAATAEANFRMSGDQARDRGDWVAAVAAYEKYLDSEPKDAPAWVQLGNCAKEAGEFKKALNAYDHALELESEMADLHHQLGHFYKVVGQFSKALESYRRAAELDPNLADAQHEIDSIEQVATVLPFLMPITFLDDKRFTSIDELIEYAGNASPDDDPFVKFENLLTA